MSRNLRVVVPGLPEGSDRPMVTSCYSWEAVVWSSLCVCVSVCCRRGLQEGCTQGTEMMGARRKATATASVESFKVKVGFLLVDSFCLRKGD